LLEAVLITVSVAGARDAAGSDGLGWYRSELHREWIKEVIDALTGRCAGGGV